MKLHFKKRVLDLDFYGEKVVLNFPTVKQYQDYQERMKDKGGDAETQLMESFLCELGLPEGKMGEMEPEHLTLLIDTLSGSKKK